MPEIFIKPKSGSEQVSEPGIRGGNNARLTGGTMANALGLIRPWIPGFSAIHDNAWTHN